MVPVRYWTNAARLKVKHYIDHSTDRLEGVACETILDMDKGLRSHIANTTYKLASFLALHGLSTLYAHRKTASARARLNR